MSPLSELSSEDASDVAAFMSSMYGIAALPSIRMYFGDVVSTKPEFTGEELGFHSSRFASTWRNYSMELSPNRSKSFTP